MTEQSTTGLRETLLVLAADGGMVELDAPRGAGCAACAVRGTCRSRALADLAPRRRTPRVERLRLPHAGEVRPGDRAVVVMSPAGFLGAVALAFALPVLALVLGVSLGAALALPDAVVALLCLPLLALSFVPLRRSESRGRLARSLRIERIIPAEQVR